jgi:hypothetical protein
MSMSEIYKQYKMFAIIEVEPEFIIASVTDNLDGNAFQFPTCCVPIRQVVGYYGTPLLVPKQEDAWKLRHLQDKIQDYIGGYYVD